METEDFTKRTKLFGSDAQRVSTQEMNAVFQELSQIFHFQTFELVRNLPSKLDHGDIDILVLAKENQNIKDLIQQNIKILNYNKNGNVYSFLYYSPIIKKTVHVDFIVSTNKEHLQSRRDYYAVGDFSAVIGVLSKRLHFKYGTEGFFKRFKDKKTNWHDLFITHNLKEGLYILGFPKSNIENLKNHDDIVDFLLSNPLLDSSYFNTEAMNAVDKQSINRRKGMDYICQKIREANKISSIKDEDYFLKQFPEIYQKLEKDKQDINSRTYAKSSVYNGLWLMKNFNLKPGPEIGRILLALTQKYGDNLHNVPENEIQSFVKASLSA